MNRGAQPRADLGDFQTPPALVVAVLDRLASLGVRWDRVVEPTCGRGHFISGLIGRDDPPREIIGFEIQAGYVGEAGRITSESTRITIQERDVFGVDLGRDLAWGDGGGGLVVLGNPPWITSAALGRLESPNRPARASVEGVKALDARTGRSNFDLAEAVWQKLLNELTGPDLVVALLCKTATARAVFRWASIASKPVAGASIHRIDARRWFGATVDACLFVVRLGVPMLDWKADVYPDLTSNLRESTLGVVDGLLVSDLDALARAGPAFGRSSRDWRQGIKHDLAPLMELTERDGRLINGLGEDVDIEPEHHYPLLKAADLAPDRVPAGRRLILTQTRLGEDPARLERTAPRLWDYLTRHAEAFGARRSRVYAGRPPFSLFGVGEYAFAPWKVAVSGFRKQPWFAAVGPIGGRPVLFDDTTYYLSVETRAEAERLAGLLNGEAVGRLLDALRFVDAKRPVTKAILSRIDLDAPALTLAGADGVG